MPSARNAVQSILSAVRLPRYAPKPLRRGFLVMLALTLALLGVSIAGLTCACGWQAMSLVHDNFVLFGCGAIVCWAHMVRADAERRALVRLITKMAGDPPPPSSHLHCAS